MKRRSNIYADLLPVAAMLNVAGFVNAPMVKAIGVNPQALAYWHSLLGALMLLWGVVLMAYLLREDGNG
jgi:hypothetical protein